MVRACIPTAAATSSTCRIAGLDPEDSVNYFVVEAILEYLDLEEKK